MMDRNAMPAAARAAGPRVMEVFGIALALEGALLQHGPARAATGARKPREPNRSGWPERRRSSCGLLQCEGLPLLWNQRRIVWFYTVELRSRQEIRRNGGTPDNACMLTSM